MIYFDILVTRKFVRVYISVRTELIGWMSILIDQRHGVLAVNILSPLNMPALVWMYLPY